MAQIEFVNLETLEAFKPIIQEIENEKTKAQLEQAQAKRVLVLVKAGLWFPKKIGE
jgi:hypothetical protein